MAILALYRDMKTTFYSNKRKVALDAHYPLMRWFFRPLSFLPAAVCVRVGLSANQITTFNIFVLAASLVCFSFWTPLSIHLGLGLFFLFYLLDFVDGNVARFTKQSSYFGQLLDGFVDSLGFLIFAVIACAFTIRGGNQDSLGFLPLFLGISASLGALISQIFRARMLFYSMLALGGKAVESEDEQPQSLRKLNFIRLANFLFLNSMTATPFILALSLLLGRVELFLCVYFIVHVFGSLGSIVGLALKNRKLLMTK